MLTEGHVNIIKAYDALLTNSHLGLIMEYAAGGNLTSYVGKKWESSKHTGLFCTEDEARFFFCVGVGMEGTNAGRCRDLIVRIGLGLGLGSRAQ